MCTKANSYFKLWSFCGLRCQTEDAKCCALQERMTKQTQMQDLAKNLTDADDQLWLTLEQKVTQIPS